MHSEDILIKKALAGDHDAFRHIVEKYQNYVFAIVLNITQDYQEAENIAQETFIQIYRSLSQYHFGGFKTWIGRIATNKAIDWKRKRKKEKENQVIYLDDLIDIRDDENNQVEKQLIGAEDLETMQSLCNKLPPKYGNVVKKYFFQSKSYKQIALEEGISIRTVETRLYRAKKILRECWKEVE